MVGADDCRDSVDEGHVHEVESGTLVEHLEFFVRNAGQDGDNVALGAEQAAMCVSLTTVNRSIATN